MLSSDPHDLIHIGGLAIQMDRYNTNSIRRQLFFDAFRVNRKRVFIRITKYDFCTSLGYRFSGGNPRMRRCNHLVAGFQTQRHECQLQGVGAVGTGDYVANAFVCSQLRGKHFHIRPLDKGSGGHNGVYRFVESGLQALRLAEQINHLDGARGLWGGCVHLRWAFYVEVNQPQRYGTDGWRVCFTFV